MDNKFRLYISMLNDQALTNIDQLKSKLNSRFDGNYEIEVIDVINNPGRIKREDQIFVTPTLIKVSPAPVKKIVGDISRAEEIIDLLLEE